MVAAIALSPSNRPAGAVPKIQHCLELAGVAAQQHLRGTTSPGLLQALATALTELADDTFIRVIWETLLSESRDDSYYIGSSRAYAARKFASEVARRNRFETLERVLATVSTLVIVDADRGVAPVAATA